MGFFVYSGLIILNDFQRLSTLMNRIELALQERLAALVNAMGYEWVGCEYHSRLKGGLLRIYIDVGNNASLSSGISFEDCAKVSHQVSAYLDVEDAMKGHYTLEISSPGLDRPLFTLAHYTRYVGHHIRLKLHQPLDGRVKLKGILRQVTEVEICLQLDQTGQELTIPFTLIEKANLIWAPA